MPTASSAPVIELPPIPARLRVPCAIWIDAPTYMVDENSELIEIQEAMEHAMQLYIENRAGAIECQQRTAKLIDAIERRQ